MRICSARRTVALPLVAVAVALTVGLMRGGNAAAGPACEPGEITLDSPPTLTANPPNINSTGGSWEKCGSWWTGYYVEWLRNGVVISGPTWVPDSPGPFSYRVQQADMNQPITSAIKPC